MKENKKTLSDFFCDPKTALKNVGILLVVAFLLVYACIQILPMFSQKLETQSALEVSVFQTDAVQGYLFRDEQVVTGGMAGTLVALVPDGARVSKGECIAGLYAGAENAELQAEIDRIDKKMEIWEKSAVKADVYVTDLGKLNEDIGDALDKVYTDVSAGNLSALGASADELLLALNKRERIMGQNGGYEEAYIKLRAERNALQSRISAVSTSVYAPIPGYYYGDIDGYEETFSVAALENLTLSGFHELCASAPRQMTGNAYGKIVDSFIWYVVCEVDKKDAAGYTEGKAYTLRFPFNADKELRGELDRIHKENTEPTALLVFRLNKAPDGFIFTRSQEVDIIRDEYTGIAVPRSALRIVDGQKGVYVLDGNIVRFRKADVLFEKDDYYLVGQIEAETPEEETDADKRTYPYISLYDNVIVTGKGLFDGRIMG